MMVMITILMVNLILLVTLIPIAALDALNDCRNVTKPLQKGFLYLQQNLYRFLEFHLQQLYHYFKPLNNLLVCIYFFAITAVTVLGTFESLRHN
jgi:hypothetical protein